MTKAKKRSIKAELVADLADYLDRRKENTEEDKARYSNYMNEETGEDNDEWMKKKYDECEDFITVIEELIDLMGEIKL